MARVSASHRRGAIPTNTFFPSKRMRRLIELNGRRTREEDVSEGGNDLVVDRQRFNASGSVVTLTNCEYTGCLKI